MIILRLVAHRAAIARAFTAVLLSFAVAAILAAWSEQERPRDKSGAARSDKVAKTPKPAPPPKPAKPVEAATAAGTSAPTPATEKPTPAPPASETPKPAPPKDQVTPSDAAPASWMAPVALGLSASCAVGLVGTMLQIRRLRREGLDFERRIVIWSEEFASSHDQEVSGLRVDIAGVQKRASDLEAALNRVRTAAERTSSQQTVEPAPEYVDPPLSEEAPEVPLVAEVRAADVRTGDVRGGVRSAVVRSADRGFLMQGQRHQTVDEFADTASSASSSSSKARLYAGMPSSEGTFPAANVTPTADQWSLYEIDPDAGPPTKGTRARLLLYSATRIHGAALAGHREYLMPVCDYDPPPQTEHTTIKMAIPGQLCFDGEQWRQTRKMKIKFSV